MTLFREYDSEVENMVLLEMCRFFYMFNIQTITD